VFKVRREQMDAYREAALRDFEHRVVQHVERCLPDRLATMGEDGVRRVIRSGIDRAATHRITAEQDVCRFIDMMLVFGAEFDQEQPWAREVLERERLAGPFTKILRLHDRALMELTR